MSVEDSAENIMSERITRYREAACDALGDAGWEINSEDELDEVLLTLAGQASRKPEAAPAKPVSDTGEILAWVDRHNDVWLFPDGGDIGYSFETQPFNREHVEKKWGPLELLSRASQPIQVEVTDEMVAAAALAILNRMMWPSLHWPNLDVLHNRDVRMAMARAALEAALGGGGPVSVEIESTEQSETQREPACVAAWPDCFSGGYDPRCCRFPKSCSVRDVPGSLDGAVEGGNS